MKMITEREMFEAYVRLCERNTSKDADGNYHDGEVQSWWYGWKLRADAEKARERINATEGMARINEIFDHIDAVSKENNGKWVKL